MTTVEYIESIFKGPEYTVVLLKMEVFGLRTISITNSLFTNSIDVVLSVEGDLYLNIAYQIYYKSLSKNRRILVDISSLKDLIWIKEILESKKYNDLNDFKSYKRNKIIGDICQ